VRYVVSDSRPPISAEAVNHFAYDRCSMDDYMDACQIRAAELGERDAKRMTTHQRIARG
jgi:hypothetical protein